MLKTMVSVENYVTKLGSGILTALAAYKKRKIYDLVKSKFFLEFKATAAVTRVTAY